MKSHVAIIFLTGICLPSIYLHAQNSAIIHVPSADEMKAGAKIEIEPQLQTGVLIREVDGKLYNPLQSQLFKTITAEVKSVYQNGVLFNWNEQKPIYGKAPHSDSLVSGGNFLGGAPMQHDRPVIGYETIFSKDILVLNFSNKAAEGEKLSFRAMQVGTTNFDGRTIELWDCGKIHIPPTPTPEQIAAAKAAQEKANAEAKAKAAAQKQDAAARALKFNQDAAAKGDMFGLLRMGERYRDGDGVEKDLAKAKEYLQKAADAGSPTAKDELSKLNQP